MAANIVSPAQSGRFYYGCAGAAGLLAGLASTITLHSNSSFFIFSSSFN